MMRRIRRDERGQSLVIILSLITLLFLLGSALAAHASVALRSTTNSKSQSNDFYAADGATELGIWWQRNGKAGNPPAQAINGITTSTTISAAGGGPGACPAAPTQTWMSGFESGVLIQAAGGAKNSLAGGLAAVNSGGALGIVDVVSSPARTGNHALRIAPNANQADYAYVEAPYGAALGPTIVAHLSVRFGTLPAADAAVFAFAGASFSGYTHPWLYLFYKASSGKWSLGLGSNTITVSQDSSTTVAANTWYSFDLRFPITASNVRTGDWYLDGVAQPSVTATDLAAGSASTPRVAFGNYALAGAGLQAYTAYFDDVILSTTASDFPIGDLNISPLKPDAMGVHNTPGNFQNEDNTAIGATSWQRLVETPMGIADSIKQVTTSSTSYIETTLSDTTHTCIRAAGAVLGLHNSAKGPNDTKTSIFDGAAETIIFSGDSSLTNGTLDIAQQPIVPGGSWTQARANGLKLRLGYGADINPLVSWDSVVVEVAWTTTVPVPATITIVGTGGGSTVSTSYTDVGVGVPTLSTWTTTR